MNRPHVLQIAVATLTAEERIIIERYPLDAVFYLRGFNALSVADFSHLVDKQMLKAVGRAENRQLAYTWTALGESIHEAIDRNLPLVRFPGDVGPAAP